jgi:hypothetical protein
VWYNGRRVGANADRANDGAAMTERPLEEETILEGLRLLQREGQPDVRSMALYLDTAPGMLKELEKAAPLSEIRRCCMRRVIN